MHTQPFQCTSMAAKHIVRFLQFDPSSNERQQRGCATRRSPLTVSACLRPQKSIRCIAHQKSPSRERSPCHPTPNVGGSQPVSMQNLQRPIGLTLPSLRLSAAATRGLQATNIIQQRRSSAPAPPKAQHRGKNSLWMIFKYISKK